MGIRTTVAAKVANVTRSLINYAVKLHQRSLEGVIAAAKARASAGYKLAEKARSYEEITRAVTLDAAAQRRKAVANAVAVNREASLTISAANGELAKYNG